jgi:cell division protein FtsB
MTGPGKVSSRAREPGSVLRGRAARLARMLPARSATAARTPFVLLVVTLLGSGLIGLLLLNTSLNQGSFQLSELKRETTELTEEQQMLQQEVDAYSAPGALKKRARELGMVPGGPPAFLDPDGTVRGTPGEASAAPEVTPSPVILTVPSPSPSPAPSVVTPVTPSALASLAPAQLPTPMPTSAQTPAQPPVLTTTTGR